LCNIYESCIVYVMSDTKPTTVETSFRVRYAETDAMGIVHHRNYIIYFEEGRSAFARARGTPYSELENMGYFLAVTEVHVRYARPARYEDHITVRTTLTSIKSRGLTFSYEIVSTETGDKLVMGETRHICIDRAGHVVRLPAIWRS
jgi:acyl-CoA thioester hydrolase